MMLNEGDQAPDVTLAMTDGTTRTLSDWRGKMLVLYFYPKDDTPGCTTEAQAFTAAIDDFAAAGAAVVGVSKDTAAKHAKFIGKYDLKVDLASDVDGLVCEAFGTWIEKSLYGRKYMGIDRATFLIDADGKIARIWRKVKVAGHADAVLTAAQAL
jgi:peroxiredoxin Q/BCP